MSIEEREHELNRMVLEGRALEAFERFYANDIEMQEDGEAPTKGKEANLAREKEFFSKVTEFRGAELHDVAIGDGVSMSIWTFDYSHEEWGDVKYDQVAVRTWDESGRILKERFFKAA